MKIKTNSYYTTSTDWHKLKNMTEYSFNIQVNRALSYITAENSSHREDFGNIWQKKKKSEITYIKDHSLLNSMGKINHVHQNRLS